MTQPTKRKRDKLLFSQSTFPLSTHTLKWFLVLHYHVYYIKVLSKYFRKRLENIPTTVAGIHTAFTVYD